MWLALTSWPKVTPVWSGVLLPPKPSTVKLTPQYSHVTRTQAQGGCVMNIFVAMLRDCDFKRALDSVDLTASQPQELRLKSALT